MQTTQTCQSLGRGTHVHINGFALRELRVLAGITTLQFVKEVANPDGKGFDRSYLSRIEIGQRKQINPNLFNRIVAALGVDRRALLAQPHGAAASKVTAA